MRAIPRPNPLLLTLATAAALAVSLLLAARADAETFCVGMSSCSGGTVEPTLEQAMAAADFNGQADKILIGPSPTAYAGKFSTQGTEKLTIEGAGQAETVLAFDPVPPAAEPATTLALLGPESVVSDLTVQVKDTSGSRALLLVDSTARRVKVEHPGPEGDLHAVELRDSTFEDGVVEMNGGWAFRGLETGNESEILDTTVHSQVGAYVATGASFTILRSRFHTERSAITVSGTSNVTVGNSVLTRSSELQDCTIHALGGTVYANHVTVIGSGYGYGVCSWSYGVNPTTVGLTNSLVYGNPYDLSWAGEPTSTATLSVQYSRFLNVYVGGSPPMGGVVKGSGNTISQPEFVDAAVGDYRLKWSSPLIDAANPVDALTLDVDALPRVVDGDASGGAVSDIGAHEYQRRLPTAIASFPSTATVGEPVQLFGDGSSDPDGDPISYAWELADGSTGAAANLTHEFQEPGLYAVTLTVTDSTGLKDNAFGTISVTEPAPTEQEGGGGSGGSDVDTVAPRIKLLAVRPVRLRLGTKLPALLSKPHGGTIRLRLSERAKLTLTFRRLSGSKAKRRRVAGRIRLQVPAGANSIRFRGRISRKRRLAPGRYRVTAVARDAAGNQGTPRSAKFRLLPRR